MIILHPSTNSLLETYLMLVLNTKQCRQTFQSITKCLSNRAVKDVSMLRLPLNNFFNRPPRTFKASFPKYNLFSQFIL